MDDDEENTALEPNLTCTPNPFKTATFCTVYGPETAGKIYGPALTTYNKYLKPNWNPWNPFRTAADFQLGRFMLEHGLSKTAIDQYLDKGLDYDHTQSFNNADEL